MSVQDCETRYIKNLQDIRSSLHPDVVSDVDEFLERYRDPSRQSESTFTRSFPVSGMLFDNTALWREGSSIGLYTGYLGQGYYCGIYYDMSDSNYVYWAGERDAQQERYRTDTWPEMVAFVASHH